MASPSSRREPLLTIRQLAERWSWSERKIRRLCVKKAIPHVRIEGGYYFEEAVLDHWLAERRVADRSAKGSTATSRRTHEEECARLGIEPYHEFSGYSRPS